MKFVKETQPPPVIEDDRTATSVEALKRALADNLFCIQGKFASISTPQDRYQAAAYTVRDRLVRRWLNTTETYLKGDARLLGKHCYVTDSPDQRNERIEQFSNLRTLSLKMLVDAVPGAGVRLVAIRELPPARGTAPEGRSRSWTCRLHPAEHRPTGPVGVNSGNW